MNRSLHIALALSSVFFCILAGAQKPSSEVVGAGYLYDDAAARNLWLSGSNAAGLRADSLNISDAVLGGGFSRGDASIGAPLQWNAGAQARTIMHLKKFSMMGSFSFRQQMSYDDCGSMFLSTGRYPVDVLEFTPGTKSRQNYAFTGGVGVDVAPQWTVGAQLDFSATNCTKRKDLRYTDYALDLSLRPGIVWHAPSSLDLGVSLRLDRNTETVDPEQIGSAESSYQAFLDKGLRYGLQQIWTNEALHLDENGINGFPVRCMGYGGAVQAAWKGWFGELSYLCTDGRIGEKDAMWYNFPQHSASLVAGKTFITGDGIENVVKLDASFERVNLKEAVMEKVTEGGVTLRRIYGYNSIFNRSRISVSPSWRAVLPGRFNASAALNYSREDGISSIKYPVLCGSTLQRAGIGAGGRIFIGPVSIPLSLQMEKGWLKEVNRGTESGLPQRQEEYFDMWKLCNTALRFEASAGVRYTFKPHVFLEASGRVGMVGNLPGGGAHLHVGYIF